MWDILKNFVNTLEDVFKQKPSKKCLQPLKRFKKLFQLQKYFVVLYI